MLNKKINYDLPVYITFLQRARIYGIFILLQVIYFTGCKKPYCAITSVDHEINNKKIELEEVIGSEIENEIYFSPLVLPVKVTYSSSSGFSIQDEGEVAILTPLGTVGVEFNVGTRSERQINGYTVTNGDFVVGLVDKKSKENNLFKIEGHNRLKVITEGTTKIDAQAGYVEIDITDAPLQELTFVDNSKFCLVNNTSEIVDFVIGLKDFTGIKMEHACKVDPFSYKFYPGSSFHELEASITNPKISISITTRDVRNNLTTTLSKEVSLGDVYHIFRNESSKILELKKGENILW